MKLLGLLGVLLWLGALLSNAGGADAARFAALSCEDDSSRAAGVLVLAATKADDTSKSPSGVAPDLDLPALAPVRAPFSATREVPPRGAGAQALRRLLVACHLGQAPPERRC